MPDRLSRALIAAVDDDLEITIAAGKVEQTVGILTSRWVGSRKLTISTMISREELTLGAGDLALAMAVESHRHALLNAPIFRRPPDDLA